MVQLITITTTTDDDDEVEAEDEKNVRLSSHNGNSFEQYKPKQITKIPK